MTDPTTKRLRLQSGYEMPVLGLGTWQLNGQACEKTVRNAIELGYRHIDTAENYGNEKDIGQALRGVDRDTLFVTSKVEKSHLTKADVLKACRESLKRLGTDYLDLYLIHWPNDAIPIDQTLDAMQQLVKEGKVRSVGLSNFDISRIKNALAVSSVPICNVQIEYHPFTKRSELPAFCRHNDITITAYSPLARGKVFNNSILVKIAEKHDKSPAQVSLKWLLQRGHIVIPKAGKYEHLQANMQLFEWQLSDDDMAEIDDIQEQQRLVDTRYT